MCDWLRCVLNTWRGGETDRRPADIRMTGWLARRHLVRSWTTMGRTMVAPLTCCLARRPVVFYCNRRPGRAGF